MHDRRNFVLIIVLAASLIWSFLAWFVFDPETTPLGTLQRVASLLFFLGIGGWLIYAFGFEDKLPDHMQEQVSPFYYGVDGLTFIPLVRASKGQAELCLYYQNRFENVAEVIVHLRPMEESFIIRPGARDVHFAFRAGGGDFGMIHQPIAVPDHLQGQVIDVQLAAASHYPRSHGARLRKRPGIPCGALYVDWGGSAFKTGVHEVSGEIELLNPTTVHLSMPEQVNAFSTGNESWRQERIAAGTGK